MQNKMKKRFITKLSVLSVIWVLSVISCPAMVEKPAPDGYTPLPIKRVEVAKIAKMAVIIRLHDAHGALKPSDPRIRMRVMEVVKAEKQVVGDINHYRLDLLVSINGTPTQIETALSWQPKRKPHPYLLTSWTVKEEDQKKQKGAD